MPPKPPAERETGGSEAIMSADALPGIGEYPGMDRYDPRGIPSGLLFLKDKRLYADRNYCLEFLRKMEDDPASQRHALPEKVICHMYWHGEFSEKQEVAVKSFLATQNLQRFQLWLWLDGSSVGKDHTQNPHLAPLLRHITVRETDLRRECRKVLPQISLLGIRKRIREYFARSAGGDTGGDQERKSFKQTLWPYVCMTFPRYFMSVRRRNLAARADVFRCVILHKYGGLYVDMDSLFLRNLEPLFRLTGPASFCPEWPGGYFANNAVLALRPYSDTSFSLIRKAVEYGTTFRPWQILQFHKDAVPNLLVLPTAFFSPSWGGSLPNAPIGEWDEFFMPAKSPRTIEQFFPGCFIYSWHGRWQADVHPDSWMSAFRQHFNARLKEKSGILDGG